MSDTNSNKYHIILLRHGESVGNAEGYHQGQSNFPLTEKGQAQAKALAAHWVAEEKAFDRVIASPQSRARQTAEIIASALGYEIEFDPIWMERDNGVLSGLRHDDAREKYPPKEFIPLYEPIGLTGESQWELYLRAGLAIQSILHQNPGRYLVVSHGGLLNMVLKAAFGITPQANFQGPRFRFRNTAFASITYFPEIHTWHVNSINACPHWDQP
jgi:2,3-bisphosphoglycerate-dependent phosphoglycerate mutase